jgi:DNA-directed RNA polymerase subunit RPC12/RpoP
LKPSKRGEYLKERKLEDGTPVCITCSKKMKAVKVTISGTEARAWRCSKCGEEIIHPEDAQLALILAQLKEGVEVRVGILNEAPYVRFPKDFNHIIHKGDVVSIILETENDIRLKVRHPETT